MRRQLLENGKAVHGFVVSRVRGDRHPDEFAQSIGVVGKTVQRMEAGGASLTHALAIAAHELEAGRLANAAYVLSMIGEDLDLSPMWSALPWESRSRP